MIGHHKEVVPVRYESKSSKRMRTILVLVVPIDNHVVRFDQHRVVHFSKISLGIKGPHDGFGCGCCSEKSWNFWMGPASSCSAWSPESEKVCL